MLRYCLVVLLSMALYLHGFFPIPTINKSPSSKNELTNNTPGVKKTVLIVIDALRMDFVTPDLMPVLSKTYNERGCLIHLKVETPTVTLPRIKAMTTGAVPQFIDILINLAKPEVLHDSFIHQAHAAGKKIVFYGDDTWLKLFPRHFERSEGTTSFFVRDFYEVDDNVTRNVQREIHRDDWDMMILHYLGLDHIGHVFGPKSPLIPIKLKEMDEIVNQIYTKLSETDENFVIIVTGDHGMRDSGGHGGATYHETNIPFIALGLSCQSDVFSQIDIPANLAALLGFNLPSTSIGQLKPSFLRNLTTAQYLNALRYNTLFLNDKISLCDEEIETANYYHEIYLLEKKVNHANLAMGFYQNCSRQISEKLLQTSVKQGVSSLLISTISCAIVLLKIVQEMNGVKSKLELVLVATIVILQFLNLHPNISTIFCVIVTAIFLKNILGFRYVPKISILDAVLILHPLIFFSSSFLEEEHQFWYFCSGTFLTFMLTQNPKNRSLVLIFVVLRFIRTINQVGDKWASSPDLSDWLLENVFYLKIYFVFSLIVNFVYAAVLTNNVKVALAVDFPFFVLVYIFRFVANDNADLGKILWTIIFVKFVLYFRKKCTIVSVWLLISLLLLKPHNSLLISCCVFVAEGLGKNVRGEKMRIQSFWWLGNVLYFVQGHDNNLSSVDISSGYVGLSSYEPILVIPQVLAHTYALPLLSHLLLFDYFFSIEEKAFLVFLAHRLYIVIVVFVVTFVFRHHLFIWSVFAPKVFVETSHCSFLILEFFCHTLYSFIKNKFV